MRNYEPFVGFRQDTHLYSAYPHEQEVILREGLQVYVLDISQITINNTSSEFKAYKDQQITVIHLYNH